LSEVIKEETKEAMDEPTSTSAASVRLRPDKKVKFHSVRDLLAAEHIKHSLTSFMHR